MITITEKAAAKIQKELDEKNSHNSKNGLPEMIGFRLAVKAGGCHGLEYAFYLIYFSDKYDTVFQQHGVKIYVDRKSLVMVDGTEIDHNAVNLLEGFVFNNPNAKSSCGCGTSFELK